MITPKENSMQSRLTHYLILSLFVKDFLISVMTDTKEKSMQKKKGWRMHESDFNVGLCVVFNNTPSADYSPCSDRNEHVLSLY